MEVIIFHKKISGQLPIFRGTVSKLKPDHNGQASHFCSSIYPFPFPFQIRKNIPIVHLFHMLTSFGIRYEMGVESGLRFPFGKHAVRSLCGRIAGLCRREPLEDRVLEVLCEGVRW